MTLSHPSFTSILRQQSQTPPSDEKAHPPDNLPVDTEETKKRATATQTPREHSVHRRLSPLGGQRGTSCQSPHTSKRSKSSPTTAGDQLLSPPAPRPGPAGPRGGPVVAPGRRRGGQRPSGDKRPLRRRARAAGRRARRADPGLLQRDAPLTRKETAQRQTENSSRETAAETTGREREREREGQGPSRGPRGAAGAERRPPDAATLQPQRPSPRRPSPTRRPPAPRRLLDAAPRDPPRARSPPPGPRPPARRSSHPARPRGGRYPTSMPPLPSRPTAEGQAHTRPPNPRAPRAQAPPPARRRPSAGPAPALISCFGAPRGGAREQTHPGSARRPRPAPGVTSGMPGLARPIRSVHAGWGKVYRQAVNEATPRTSCGWGPWPTRPARGALGAYPPAFSVPFSFLRRQRFRCLIRVLRITKESLFRFPLKT